MSISSSSESGGDSVSSAARICVMPKAVPKRKRFLLMRHAAKALRLTIQGGMMAVTSSAEEQEEAREEEQYMTWS